MTTEQFAEMLKLKSAETVRRMCRSREWRKNKLARKIGNQWRIDVDRYQKLWAGELKLKIRHCANRCRIRCNPRTMKSPGAL